MNTNKIINKILEIKKQLEILANDSYGIRTSN
jgi:hypothetical protein